MDPFADLWGTPQGSDAGPLTVQLLKRLEGFTPRAKWDYKQYSGGYGTRAQPGETFTPESAEARLNQDIAPVNNWLNSNVTQPLTPERRAAFNSFGVNLGTGNLNRLLPDINRGDWPTVGDRMLSFNKAGGEVNQGLINRRRQEAALVTGGAMPEGNPMPMMQPQTDFPPRQPGPLTNAMGGLSDSMVPGIFGGGDQPGYFGRLLSDPTFLMGTSVLGAGLAGRDAGSALTQGATAAAATADLSDRRRRAMTWQKIMGGSTPDATSPLLKGIPAEALPIIQSMGPEEGMKMLHQFALQRMAPHKLGTAAPGSTVFDEQTMQPLFQAPTISPYAHELGIAQAKADVKQGQSAVAGKQMLDLTDRMISLAGAPGSPERQTFGDATGPLQGTNWYQGIKGFVNSKAETPVVYRNLQQDLGTIKLLASRAYLSGEGQVSDNERRMVGDAVGNVESAPNAEAAVQAMQNLKQIVTQVFMKPAAASGGAPSAPAPAAPSDVAMPGMSVQGGLPGVPEAAPGPPPAPPPQGGPAPQQGGPVPQGAPPEPAVQLLRQNPAPEIMQQFDAKYGPGAAQQIMGGTQPGPGGSAPAPAAAAPSPFSRDASPLWARGEDQATLRANPTPQLIQQYDAVFGPGSAAKVLMKSKASLGMGRGSYRAAP